MEPKKLWFKAKRYGWGWYPGAWQGWAVLGVYLAGFIIEAFLVDYSSVTIPATFWSYLVYIFFSTTFLIIICYVTGEKPGWRWGTKTKNKENGTPENKN